MKQTEIQVGGDHYKKYKMQPMDFAVASGLSFPQGSVVKYVVRHKDKGGKEDLMKAKHICDMMVERRQYAVDMDNRQRALLNMFVEMNGMDLDMEMLIADVMAERWVVASGKIYHMTEREYGND